VKVVLHPAAVADLSAAGDWYERQRPGLGVDLIVEIERALEVIAESPTAWPRWPDAPTELEIRRVLLPRFPHCHTSSSLTASSCSPSRTRSDDQGTGCVDRGGGNANPFRNRT